MSYLTKRIAGRITAPGGSYREHRAGGKLSGSLVKSKTTLPVLVVEDADDVDSAEGCGGPFLQLSSPIQGAEVSIKSSSPVLKANPMLKFILALC